MIDPLRPYWPTNRSIAGLLVRVSCLLAAATAVALQASRSLAVLVVLAGAFVQAALLAFEWMELKRVRRSVVTGAVLILLFLFLLGVLVIESRSVLVSSVR